MLTQVIVNVFNPHSDIPECLRLAPLTWAVRPNQPPLFAVVAERLWVGGVSTPQTVRRPYRVDNLPPIPVEICATGRAVLLEGRWYAA